MVKTFRDNRLISSPRIVSSFTFNPRMTHPDIEFFSYKSDTISSLSLQERVALGSRGFRQGIHYWEITIQRYDDKPDPAFGIARFDVSKETMLGKSRSIHSDGLFTFHYEI